MDIRISKHLKNRKRSPLNSLKFPFKPQEAAVLALLYRNNGDDTLLFTKRSHQVAHHKGQICFPGGACDERDESLWATALRETGEEIGVSPDNILFIGELGQVLTPTGFRITPFIGRIITPQPWKPNPDEIDEIFTIPLSHLLNPQNFHLETRKYFEQEYQDPVYLYQQHEIWGATGRIIADLLDVWRSVESSNL